MIKALTKWKANHPGFFGPTAKRLIFAGLRATSTFRVLPDFMVIGAQKCGTTSLFNHLAAHPQVAASLKKEVAYFNDNRSKSPHWYRAHFPTSIARRQTRARHGRVMVGEATSGYIYDPVAPTHAARLLPNVRMILLTRDPVRRAFSHYHHNVRKRIEKRAIQPAFDTAFDRISDDIDEWYQSAKTGTDHLEPIHSYLIRGLYGMQLDNWTERFSAGQILVVKSEQLAESLDAWERILDFLDLEPWRPDEFRHFNTGSYEAPSLDLEQRVEDFYANSGTLEQFSYHRSSDSAVEL